MDNRSIGVFDSGTGGLTVVKEVMKTLPGESIVYFGDTAHVPYGSKYKDTITKLSKQSVSFLLSKDVKAIIIACGTISACSYDILAASFDVPIVDTLTSGVQAALKATKNNKIGIIATEATIQSGRFQKYMQDSRPELEIYAKACPLFTPLVEEGWTDNPVAQMAAEIYLRDLSQQGIDSLFLGCTHYPLLYNSIKLVVGDIEIINPAEPTAGRMKALLEEKHMLSEPGTIASHTFYTSGDTAKFEKQCNMVLKSDYPVYHADYTDEP